MKVRKILVWSVIIGWPHPQLNKKERREWFVPLVRTLFPGIDCIKCARSPWAFSEITKRYLSPALIKLFPELELMTHENVNVREKVEVGTFLPSKGSEWQESDEWKTEFLRLLQQV